MKKIVIAATLLVGVAAQGQVINPGSGMVVKPRVFVIFDTSTSMKQAPDYLSSFGYYPNQDTSTDPDGSPVPDASCQSKFCIAKKTVYEVLRGYADDNIRLGVASYYQYLVKYDPQDNRISRCWYDTMWKAGKTLRYPRNGGWLPDANAFVSTTNVDLTGPTDRSNHRYCKSGTASYDLTAETNPMGNATCRIYDRTSNPGTMTLATPAPTLAGCTSGRSYTLTNYDSAKTPGLGVYYRYQISSAASCPAAVPTSMDYSGAPPASIITVAPSAAANLRRFCDPANAIFTDCWQDAAHAPFGGTLTDTCSDGHPCKMYSASTGTELPQNTTVAWLGYFGGSCTGGSQPLASNGGDSNATTGVCAIPAASSARVPTFYDATRTQGATTNLVSTFAGDNGTCRGLFAAPGIGTQVRITTGTIADYVNISVATQQTQAGVAANTLDGARPTNCGSWPCDVTLSARTPDALVYNYVDVNTCTTQGGPVTFVTCDDPGAADPQVQALKTGASCPGLAGPQSSTAGYTWNGAAPAGCAVGNECTFTARVPAETTVAMPGCASTVSVWNGSTPAACTFGGVTAPAYSAGVPQTFKVFQDVGSGSACTAVNAVGMTGVTMADATQLTNCVGSGACPVSGGVSSNSPNNETTSSTTSLTPPVVVPAWGGQTDNPLGVFIDQPPGTCGAVANGTISTAVGGVITIFRAGGGPGNTTQTGLDGETPLYNCRYERVSRQWSRPKTRCTYDITRVDHTVTANITWCNYDQKRIRRGTATQTYTCEYTVPLRKFEFQRPTYKVCDYFTTETTLTRPTPNVRYTYSTKGGEFIGSIYREFTGIDASNVGVPYASFSDAAKCPLTIDDCQGAGTVCYLRANGDQPVSFSSSSWTRGTAATRYSNLKNTNHYFILSTPTTAGAGPKFGAALIETGGHIGVEGSIWDGSAVRTGGGACVATDFATPPVAPPAARNAFASFNGATLPPPMYKLVSDYMDCVDENNPASCVPNAVASINGDPRVTPKGLKPSLYGTYSNITDSNWTSAPTKAYGASLAGASYATPSLMTMDFPADNDATGNVARFKDLMSTCKRPSTVNSATEGQVTWPASVLSTSPIVARNGDKVEWNGLGLCMPDVGAPNGSIPAKYDFTPLYGSLRNVKKYLENTLETDPNHQCRKYFVVLATDGQEDTPKNAAYQNETALTSAVSALRNVSSISGHTKDVNTFVLGFGDSTTNPTDAYNLNQMAIAGNTAGAYFATNRADLQVRLAQIFNTITQGTYSRSRPVLTSDGTGLYAAYYDVRTNTPEWQGHLAAIGFDSGGNQLTRWEFGAKLDDGTSDASRNLYTMGGPMTPSTKKAWTVANVNDIKHFLNADSDYFGGPGYTGATTAVALNPQRVLEFVRNIAKVTGNVTTGEDYFQSGTPNKRLSRYGATVRGVPVVVSKSFNSPDWGGKTGQSSRTSYATFQANVLNREQRVVFGSTDGLLRSVRDRITDPACSPNESAAACPNGREGWGWVPTALQPVVYKNMLGYSPGVDGDIWLEDICVGSDAEDCSVANWRTVAFVGMRGGGRGVQAFDVTDPANPQSLWSFHKYRGDDQLGYPITAAVGRVEVTGGHDRYIAVIPGGTRQGGVYGNLGESNADEVYVLNAADGTQLEFFNSNGGDDCTDNASADVLGCNDLAGNDNQFIAKPSYFRRLNSPYMDNMVLNGTSGLTYIMRFRKKVQILGDGTVKVDPIEQSNKWEPVRFFDPTNPNTSHDPLGAAVKVRRVVDTAGVYTLQDCQGLADGAATCGALPLPAGRRLPFHNRPRVGAVTDPNGLVADYFFGTGDTLNPVNPGGVFTRNYFFAVHDGNSRDDGRDDAQPLWVNQFIDAREQVIGDPVLVNGNILVSTYIPPPASASDCTVPGDARLYCFNPKNGDLVNCLVQGGGTTSVLTFLDVGPPTPPVCIGNNCYTLGSNSPLGPDGTPQLNRSTVVPPTPSGDTRSFRRVR
jgi:hypothetical protein